MHPRVQSGLRLAALALIALTCLVGLGRDPIHETDEGFAANRAASFARHGSSVLTYDDVDEIEPQFRKPPLLYWCVAGCYKLLGRSEFSARLPTALFSIGLCAVLVAFLRRYVPEYLAWCGVLLFAAVPFVTFHMRTAMLEMPFLFFSMLAIHLLSHRPGAGWALLAGLACGAAALIKGAAGLPPLAFAAVISYVVRDRPGRWHWDILLAVTAATAVLVAYFVAVPTDWRMRAWLAFFAQEGVKRQVHDRVWERLAASLHLLFQLTGPLLPAAAAGFVAALGVGRRGRALAVALLIVLPSFVVAALQMVPYPRYFFVIYPVLTTLAVVTGHVLAGGGTALWLLPFLCPALVCCGGSSSWLLAVLAVLIWLGGRFVSARHCVAFRALGLASFTLALGFHLWGSPAVLSWVDHEGKHDRPAMLPLARRVPDLVPPGQTLLIAGDQKFKCHQLLFYGDRALETAHLWARYGLSPGTERVALQYGGGGLALPLVDEFEIARSREFRLVRLRVREDAAPFAGVFGGSGKTHAPSQLTATALGLTTQPDGKYLLVHRPPVRPFAVLRTQEVRAPLQHGQSVTCSWAGVQSVSGLDVTAAEPNPALRGLRVEWQDEKGHWQEWISTSCEPFSQLDLEGDRLVKRTTRALRLRGDPRVAAGVRVTRSDPTPLQVGELIVYVTADAASGKLSPENHE